MTTKTLQYSNSPAPSRLWLAAIKPPMYSVAIMPIGLGSAIAYANTQAFDRGIFITFLLSAILILAWENLSNDVFDSETGIDRNKAHSVVNLTGNKALTFWLSNLCLGLGVLGVLSIAWRQQDFTVLGLILLCCGLGYLYQGPPFRWGYRGLGEILCFFSFGPLAVAAAYYSQTQSWSLTSFLAAIILGVSTSLILFCSHFHQVQDDLAAGKRSPIVRMGTQLSAQLLPWLCAAILLLPVLFVLLHLFPTWTLLTLASLPIAVNLCRHVLNHHDTPDRVSNCKFIAVSLHFWSGMLLALGFVL